MSVDENTSLFASPSEPPQQKPLYYEATQTKQMKWILVGFLAFVVVNLALSTILVSLQAAQENGLFVLLLISLLAFAQFEFFLVFFIYRGHLPQSYFWWIFIIGVLVVIEAIGTDIIVYTIE